MMMSFHDRDNDDDQREQRDRMVEKQLLTRGIKDTFVLAAMARVPREAFVPEGIREMAYADGPLPIGREQTISQPYVVAAMSEALRLAPGARVLEVGTGSGYQTAVLVEMGFEVYTVERISSLHTRAMMTLKGLGYHKVRLRRGDGWLGWPEEAPFDGILVTAAAPELPFHLIEQLSSDGRLVIPMGKISQELRVYQKNDYGEYDYEVLFPVRFVPLIHG